MVVTVLCFSFQWLRVKAWSVEEIVLSVLCTVVFYHELMQSQFPYCERSVGKIDVLRDEDICILSWNYNEDELDLLIFTFYDPFLKGH